MRPGFSTLEILIAIGIMSSTLVAVSLLTFGVPTLLAHGHTKSEAYALAETAQERARVLGATHFSLVASLATSTSDTFQMSTIVTLAGNGSEKRIRSLVSWNEPPAGTQYVYLDTLISDYQHPPLDACFPNPTGNWQNPTLRTYSLSSSGLLPATLASTYSAAAVAASTSTLMVAADVTSAPTDPTLFLFSIAPDSTLSYLGSLDNAPTTKSGPSALALGPAPYVYAANGYGANFGTCTEGPSCSQLQVIDISNSGSPTVARNVKLATSSGPLAQGSGGQASGASVAYQGGYVYLGLAKTSTSSGDEFSILDVSDPLSPIWKGGVHIGRTINAIRILNGYAYLATDDSTRELVVVHIEDPSHPTIIGSYDPPGTTNFGLGSALTSSGAALYLGRTYVSNGPELVGLTVDSPETPAVLSSLDLSTLLSHVSVKALLARDYLLFVLTTHDLRFYDISDPRAPVVSNATLVLPNGSTPTALTCSKNTLYISSTGADGSGTISVVSAN